MSIHKFVATNIPLKSSLVAVVCAILFIWVIPNTIALRNVLLAIGAIVAIYIIFSGRQLFSSFSNKWLPLLALILLYCWALMHYQFFSLDRTLELSELKSIWIRSLAGSLIALALPICFYGNWRLRNYFFLFLFSTPIINIALYFLACFSSGYVITPQEYVVDFAFKKIETVFFGSLASSVAAANLAYIFSDSSDVQSTKISRALIWVLGIALCFVSAVISNTKNGILIPLFIVFLLGAYLLVVILKKRSNRRAGTFLLIGLIVFSLGAWRIQSHFSTGGWETLVSDVKTAIDVENQSAWRTGNPEYILPLNDQGKKVSGSTYMRVAWAVVGMRMIGRHPFGYGSIGGSYHGLLEMEKIDPGKHGQTHSGWVDFGLAYGIPGLVFLVGAFLAAIYLSPRADSLSGLQTFFIAATFLPLSLIAETAWKQYFEATLFFATYTAALLIIASNQSESADF